MSQYEEMYLARLKCELRKRDGRGRKWELFQQATTAELMVSVSHVWLLVMSTFSTRFMFVFNYLK